jgi:hypothetical protein
LDVAYSKRRKILATNNSQAWKKYDSPTFNPHITVYGGVQSISAAKSTIRNCKDMKKFAVKVTDLEFSGNLWKTMFINVGKITNKPSL